MADDKTIKGWGLRKKVPIDLKKTEKSKKAIARWLAQQHRENLPSVKEVYWFPDNSQNLNDFEVRLLEIEDGLSPTDENDELFTVSFDEANRAFPFRCEIAGIAPNEYERRQRFRLPKTWGDWEKAVPLEV